MEKTSRLPVIHGESANENSMEGTTSNQRGLSEVRRVIPFEMNYINPWKFSVMTIQAFNLTQIFIYQLDSRGISLCTCHGENVKA